LDTDRKKLEHILSNYLSNAIKFTREDSKVSLVCQLQENVIEFIVTDQGPGIPDEYLEKVFERFYQVQDSPTQQEGTGLGLALCHEFAQVLNGSVHAESSVGEGSRFYLTLPYIPSIPPIHTEDENDTGSIPGFQSSTSPRQRPVHAPKLMIVEDNRNMREFLMQELEMYQIVSAENGKAALESLERMESNASLPDLIITDVMMPEMDGFELLQRLKDHTAHASIPVIMLTARAGVEDKLKALRIGVHDYITKPFDTEELRVRIENLLDRKIEKSEALSESDDEPIMDHAWLAEVETLVNTHLGERDFSVARLAFELHISERQLLRRLKAYTGLAPGRYIREVRLHRAKEMLESGGMITVAGLSASVGFEDPDYFSRIYMERFGYRPNDRLRGG
jgi:DNA-binding response OmpR family regulator/anti-sigma regulatory factor (Ser/Thr protein kinase)